MEVFECFKLLLLLTMMRSKSFSQTLDFNLRISRTDTTFPSQPASFSCVLSSSVPPVTSPCKWITPQGKIVTVYDTTGEVEDENNKVIKGWSAGNSNNKRNCTLIINATKEEDFGSWSCIMEGQTPPFHMGTFYMVSNLQSPGFLTDVRLPRHVMPQIYDLLLVPILEVGNFTTLGSVKIHFSINASNDGDHRKVYVHQRDILIHEHTVKVKRPNGMDIPIMGHEYDLERELYVVHLREEMESTPNSNNNNSSSNNDDNHNMYISFTSIINADPKMLGFFCSSYTDASNNMTKYLVMTTFEPIFAREAFPCMDEPDMKAIFRVKLGRKKTMTARSNMDNIGTEAMHWDNLEGYEIDTFRESVPMSTYLLAFLVSEFNSTSNLMNDSFKIWHDPAKGAMIKLALDVGLRLLQHYGQYFDAPYSLPKMDFAVIPAAVQALESWGLIPYPDQKVLYDDELKLQGINENVVYLIAHELAHQWFGNLVTMKWWTNVWLKEGFATYVHAIGVEHILPEYKYADREFFRVTRVAFTFDAYEDAEAMSKPVLNPLHDLEPGYGYRAYQRAACIIHMMEAFLTPLTFLKGVKMYLKDQQYKSSDRRDLWNALNMAAKEDNIELPNNMDVESIMENWTLQAGYPVVTVTTLTLDSSIYLNQKRFIFNPIQLEVSSLSLENACWHIPVSLEYPGGDYGNARADIWLHPNENNTRFNRNLHFPYVLNVRSKGLYRVNYDVNNWKQLGVALLKNHTSIHLLSRARINDDSHILARAGQLHYNLTLGITRYLSMERDLVPLKAMMYNLRDLRDLINMGYLHKMLDGTEVYPLWERYLVNLLAAAFDESIILNVGADTSIVDIEKQILLMDWTCFLGHQNCIKATRKKFREWMSVMDPDTNNPIHPYLRVCVYKAAVRAAEGRVEINFLLARLSKAKDDVFNIISGLGSTDKVEIILELLNMTVNESFPIMKERMGNLYMDIGATAKGRRLQFDWLRGNYEAFKNLSEFNSMVLSIVGIFLEGAKTSKELEEVEMFHNMTRDLMAWKKSEEEKSTFNEQEGYDDYYYYYMQNNERKVDLDNQKRVALANIRWMDNYYKTVAAWLKEEMKEVSSTSKTAAKTSQTTTSSKTSKMPATNPPREKGAAVSLQFSSFLLLLNFLQRL